MFSYCWFIGKIQTEKIKAFYFYQYSEICFNKN